MTWANGPSLWQTLKQTIETKATPVQMDPLEANSSPYLPAIVVGFDRIGMEPELQALGHWLPAQQPNEVPQPGHVSTNPNLQFRTGPLASMVVTLALMQMVEAGKIELDVELQKQNLLPFEIKNNQIQTNQRQHLTPRMLLNQTSCIADDWNLLRFAAHTPNVSLADFLRIYFKEVAPGTSLPLGNFEPFLADCAPGGNWSYSNVALALSAYLVERASGIPFHTYVEQNIFQPLGMKDTAWFHPKNPKQPTAQHIDFGPLPQDNLGLFYPHWFNNIYHVIDVPKEPYLPPYYPAFNLYSTAQDMLRLLQTLAEGKLLSPETWAHMWRSMPTTYYEGNASPIAVSFGFGMFRWQLIGPKGNQSPIYGIAGSDYGLSVLGVFQPGSKRSFVTLSEGRNILKPQPELLLELMQLWALEGATAQPIIHPQIYGQVNTTGSDLTQHYLIFVRRDAYMRKFGTLVGGDQ